MQAFGKGAMTACEKGEGLDSGEADAIAGFVSAHKALKHGMDDALQRAHHVSLSEFDVMHGLMDRDGRFMRMSEVAEMVQLSLSGTTRLVERLELRGLVRRETCPSDRRGLNAVLTDEGVAIMERAMATHREAIREQFLRHFSDDELRAIADFSARILGSESTEGST